MKQFLVVLPTKAAYQETDCWLGDPQTLNLSFNLNLGSTIKGMREYRREKEKLEESVHTCPGLQRAAGSHALLEKLEDSVHTRVRRLCPGLKNRECGDSALQLLQYDLYISMFS